MKALTALLGYLSVLLEYIQCVNLLFVFHSNFIAISLNKAILP